MEETSFKERVRQAMIESAKEYKEIYVDYEYLICSEAFTKNEFYIVKAETDNFQHLTGVHSLIGPQDFFEKCYSGTLQEQDFDFVKKGQDEKSVKGTVRRKIKVLPDMMQLFNHDLVAEESFHKNKVRCSFAAADGSCTLGFSESAKARPKSLIKGNELSNSKPVELILRKKPDAEYFDEIIVGDNAMLKKYQIKIESVVKGELFITDEEEENGDSRKC